jgi:hypothetical protein
MAIGYHKCTNLNISQLAVDVASAGSPPCPAVVDAIGTWDDVVAGAVDDALGAEVNAISPGLLASDCTCLGFGGHGKKR